MRVLIISNIPSPYRVDFYNELGKKVELTVLYERESASDRDNRWNNKNQRTFKEIYLNCKPIGSDKSIGIKWFKYISDRNYDILCISGYSSPTVIFAITYCIFKKIPYILTSDGAFIKKDRFYKKILKNILIGEAKAWLCTGMTSKEYLKQYGAKEENIFIYPFTSLKKEDVVPEPISEEQKKIFKKKLGINGEKVVLSVGRFIFSKGYDILLNAFKNIDSKISVYIVGGKPTEEYLKIKNELNLTNVYFIDFKPKDKLKEYYKAADLFVLPTRNDVWGLVINEAMAYGLPIITTDKCIAGLELVEDDINGYIIPTEDEKLLALKINKVLSDSNLSDSMSKASLDKIMNYTIEKMATIHIEIFEKILDI